MSFLILPGSYEYQNTLANIPAYWNNKRELLPSEGGAIIYDGETNLPRIATWKETQEYLMDGEYDLRMDEIESAEDDDDWDNFVEEPHEITDADLRANWEFMKACGRL